MDWTFLQSAALSLVSFALTAGITVGCAMLTKYTGIKVSAENEEAIRRAATTEAGKLITLGLPVTVAAAHTAASKVVADLPKEVRAEGYNQSDIADMVIGAASMAFPPIGIVAPVLKQMAGAILKS